MPTWFTTSGLVLLLALPVPALATKPCWGQGPEWAFERAEPRTLRLPADARLLCGLGREPVLREVVPAGARPRPGIALTPWPGAPPFTCYTLPARPHLTPGRRYLWRTARDAESRSSLPEQIVEVAPAAPGPPPGPPVLVPREIHPLHGACPPHAALEFVPPGAPSSDGAQARPDGPAPVYRWEVRLASGERVAGPSVGFAPRVLATDDPGFLPALRPGRYLLTATAIDPLGRDSAPATVDFRIELGARPAPGRGEK